MVNMGDCLIFFLLLLCVLGICNVMPFDIHRFSMWYLIFPLFIIDLVYLFVSSHLIHLMSFCFQTLQSFSFLIHAEDYFRD